MATTITPPKTKKLVGERVRRKEDPRLITGTAAYLDDIKKPGMLHAAILRSPYGAARIRGIAVDAARDLPGVRGVFTAPDFAGVGPLPCAASLPGLRVPEHTVLAAGRVYYVGHPVAVVVAADRYIAFDALDRIEVDYDPAEAITDVEKAAEDGAPLVHPQFGSNIAYTHEQSGGDVEKAFTEADVVIKQRITSPRLIPAAMETRGVVADWDEGAQELTLFLSTQNPHLARTQLAQQLGLPEHRLRVIAPEIGGGFGSKIQIYAEDAIAGWLAMRLKRPVKWIESRREGIQGTIHGRGHVDYAQIAAKKDGAILGMKLKIYQDLGSFLTLFTPAIPTLSILMMPGLYKFRNVRGEVVGVFTNCMATDAYRGAGRPEATYVIERMVDRVADELGLDPAEVRLKNFPAPEDFPFTTATGLLYDSGDYGGTLKMALEKAGYAKLLREQREGREQGRLVGIGISTYGEICAFGPSPQTPAGGWESATVRIEPSGQVTVLTGSSPHGQGQETTFSQMVHDELQVEWDDIVVLHGDTGRVPYGVGTFGSRATAIGGSALKLAIEDVRQKALNYAAHLLGAQQEDVRLEDGVFSAAGAGKRLTWKELAQESIVRVHALPGSEPGLSSTRIFEPPNYAFPFGAHIVMVEIDRETGQVKILRYLAVDDCGNQINPLTVDGQRHGGIAQGLGQALLEEVIYDESGQLLSGTFMDYAVPKAQHMPWIETAETVTPTDSNPLGVKGVGEAGTIGSTPAIMNAVVDALSPLGVKHVDIPATPMKIWSLIQERSQP